MDEVFDLIQKMINSPRDFTAKDSSRCVEAFKAHASLNELHLARLLRFAATGTYEPLAPLYISQAFCLYRYPNIREVLIADLEEIPNAVD